VREGAEGGRGAGREGGGGRREETVPLLDSRPYCGEPHWRPEDPQPCYCYVGTPVIHKEIPRIPFSYCWCPDWFVQTL
jgi:hypothetical protein